MPLLHLEPIPRRTTKGELLDFLIATGGIGRAQVGRIDLNGNVAVIEVPAGWETRLVKALDGAALKERRVRAWATETASAPAGEDHFRRLARLLELESQAEARQTSEKARQLSPAEAERAGDCLTDLVIVDETSGLGGRCILTLAKRNRSLALPWTRLQPGTPVLLAPEKAEEGRRGVVCERAERVLRVALNEPPEEEKREAIYRLHLAGDEVARQRQLQALERARTANRERLAELRSVLLGEAAPAFGPETACEPLGVLD